MRFRSLCDSAKRGRVCMDDICRGSDITLCGFDKDFYDEMVGDDADDNDVCFDPDCEQCNEGEF